MKKPVSVVSDEARQQRSGEKTSSNLRSTAAQFRHVSTSFRNGGVMGPLA
jgi:hypothetical protein